MHDNNHLSKYGADKSNILFIKKIEQFDSVTK
jgi:hypothetical protein